MIYFLVALLATSLGAASGLGGGVIIKPVLDTIGQYDIITIGLLSSFTVLSMAIVSTVKQYVSGIRFEGRRTIFLSIGSIFGGITGKLILSSINETVKDKSLITAGQSLILALLLILVLIYLLKKNIQSLHIHSNLIIISAGFILGLIASFLGVGGGPFNVLLLVVLFSMETRSAAVHSILIILFSQLAKLLAVFFDTGFSPYDLSMLLYMIPAGIAGGFIGSSLNHKLRGQVIRRLFMIVIIAVIALNIYNFIVETQCIASLQ